MADFLSPTIKVTRVRKGPLAIVASAAVSIGAFLGIAQKGPVATPTLIQNPTDFQQVFGEDRSDSYLYEEVRLFFQNGGGACYVSRAAHYTTVSNPTSYDMVAASRTLVDGAAVNAITVSASSPGVWGNSFKVTTLKRSVLLTTIAVAISAGAFTQATLTDASRVRVGDMITLADGVNSNTVTVTSKVGNVIYFASVVAGVGGIGTSGSSATSLVFDLTAIDNNGLIARKWTDLRMSALSDFYVVDVVNSTYRTPFTIADLASATADNRPANVTASALASGSDGGTVADADYVGDSAAKNGLYAFDAKSDFGMLSVPGITSATVARGLSDYAESRKLFMAYSDVPSGTSPSGAVTYVNTTINRFSAYAAIIYPWLKIVDVDGVVTTVPSVGAWQGITARTDRTRGVGKAPAGIIDGQILGISGVETEVQEPDYDVLYPAKINAIQVFPGQGTAVMGNITLDPTGEFGELNVARLFLYVERSCRDSLRWVNFEPNNATTRARVTRNVSSFLRGLWEKGQLDGEKPSEAFIVQCDTLNNDAITRSQRKLVVRISIAPVHAAEFIDITVELDTRALDAALAA